MIHDYYIILVHEQAPLIVLYTATIACALPRQTVTTNPTTNHSPSPHISADTTIPMHTMASHFPQPTTTNHNTEPPPHSNEEMIDLEGRIIGTVSSIISVVVIITLVVIVTVYLITKRRHKITVPMVSNEAYGVTLQDMADGNYSTVDQQVVESINTKENEAYATNIKTKPSVAYAVNINLERNEAYSTTLLSTSQTCDEYICVN